MKDIFIFGTNDFAQMLYWNIQYQTKSEFHVLGFVLDDSYYESKHCCGLDVFPYSKILMETTVRDIFICVGYSRMNQNRKDIFERLLKDGWHFPNYIDETASVRTDYIGMGNIIFEGSRLSIQSSIGNGNIFYPNSHLAHHSTMGDFNYVTICASISGHVEVGNCCFFGANSCTRDKIRIQDRSLLGAGCYLSKSTDHPDGVYVPPRSIELQRKSYEIDL